MVQRFYVETLGCPKNQVDSEKLIGTLLADGMVESVDPEHADLVVVNTCAFIDDARRESIDTILALEDRRKSGAKLVVTGCMAERYGDELAEALPEVDQVAGFGVPVSLGRKPLALGVKPIPSLDLLNLPRPRSAAPWAYVKIAEGCDRSCGFCAIPSFRGPQRSRDIDSILAEVAQTGAQEIVLVAQDLASYGKDRPGELGAGSIVPLITAVSAQVRRTRLLYLYPSDLTDELIEAMLGTGVPYFDLSLQHVSKPLLRRMRRWGDGERFLRRIADIRAASPDAAFRSNFIVGYPGETEEDHDLLLDFVEAAQLDWCGFFSYSAEEGTYAVGLDGEVDPGVMNERLAELRELQDGITASRARRSDRRDDRGARRRPRGGAEPPRGAGDRRDRPAADLDRNGDVRDGSGRRRARPGPGRRRLLMPVDPGAIATWANAVTVARVLTSPVLFALIPDHKRGSWLVFALWFLLCSTDGIDGYLARRHGTTRSGAFLDPLADKILVLGAMFTLVDRQVFWFVPVVLIAARELGISVYRTVVGAQGVSVPASKLGKLKTVSQQFAVAFALLPLTALDARWLWLGLLWVAVVLTLVSGAQYMWKARKGAAANAV